MNKVSKCEKCGNHKNQKNYTSIWSTTPQGDLMSVTDEDVRKFLSKRNIPIRLSIVPLEIIFVSAGKARKIEIFGFISSVILLLAGVFLGVILTPDNQLFLHFLLCGIVTLVCGSIIFIIGVHREINEWEKKKIPLRW